MPHANILIEISPKEMITEPGLASEYAVKSLQETLAALSSLNETLDAKQPAMRSKPRSE